MLMPNDNDDVTDSPPSNALAQNFQEVVLAFLDVLGFSKLVHDIGLEAIHGKYEELIQLTVERTKRRTIVVPVPTGDGGVALAGGSRDLSHAYFSDTFLLWGKYEIIFMESFLDSIMHFFCDALCNGIPIRGCICFGRAVMDVEKAVYIGKPIIEGHLGEGAQHWLGISFAHSIENPYPHWVGALRQVVPYADHIKPDKNALVSRLVLDWPRCWRENYVSKTGFSAAEKLSELDKKPDFSYIYKNTKKFVAFSDASHNWWQQKDVADIGIGFGAHNVPLEKYGK